MEQPVSGLFGHIMRHRRPKPAAASPPAPESAGYERLRQMARRHLRLHRRGTLMQTTVLAHEAWLRIRCSLESGDSRQLQYAAMAIRAVLVDEARKEGAAKRGGAWRRIPLDESRAEDGPAIDLLDLEEALLALERTNPRAVRIVELRFFGGLTVDETAQLLGIGERTVDSEFRLARAVLRAKLEKP